MNKVALRFIVQCRRQALVAYCRRCSAILSELQFTIVTVCKTMILKGATITQNGSSRLPLCSGRACLVTSHPLRQRTSKTTEKLLQSSSSRSPMLFNNVCLRQHDSSAPPNPQLLWDEVGQGKYSASVGSRQAAPLHENCQDKAISSSGHVTACAVPLPLFN